MYPQLFGTVVALAYIKSADWSFGPRRQIAFPMFGDGIFTQEGPAWKHSRDLLRPHLAYKKYEDLKVFVEPIDDLLRVLPQDGGVIDLQPFFFRFTLDVATAFLFGDSIHSLQSTETRKEKDFALAFDLAQKYIVKRFRLLDLYFLIGGSKFHDACSRVQTFADEIIERNLLASIDEHDTDNSRYVFLKSVAEAFPDRASLRGQIISLLVAGRDTTACLLSWTL
jgi:cytochrome P450